jgi:hypothetical protein
MWLAVLFDEDPMQINLPCSFMEKILTFDDRTIQAIFGHEAAEQEDLRRLQQYYFKGQTFKRMMADLPLRILVGQKGIGKSALLTVAKAEDEDQGKAVLFLRPEDVHGVGDGGGDFRQLVNEWKDGISDAVQILAFQSMGMPMQSQSSTMKSVGRVLSFIKDTARPYFDKKIDCSPLEKVISDRFLKANQVTIYIDDLDRGWEGKRKDIRRVSAFLIAIKDLSAGDSGLYFKIAIRSDVFYAIRKTEADTDKLEGSLVWQTWTNHEILFLLVKRILTYFNEPLEHFPK